MIVDGRKIADGIYSELKNTLTHMDVRPHLIVFTCAPNFETQKFLALKRKKAHAIGIDVNVIEFPEDITTEEIIQSMQQVGIRTDGIIVQLPLPEHIDTTAVLQCIPLSLDVDAVHYDGTSTDLLPPVVGAIREIADVHDVLFAATNVTVIGQGRLVGKPAALWAMRMGAQVKIVSDPEDDLGKAVEKALILILGAGHPNLITPDMIDDNVLIFDAGTSEEGGVLVGDADPACADKAALITPVPGGIGPITIAVLLRNLVTLSSQ